MSALHGDREPLPVDDLDLGALAARPPVGRVPTRLDLSRLDDRGFEGLIFALLASTEGYENVDWLMETRAADRGRDLSAQRVSVDALSGTRRERVIVQCKAWRRSLGIPECAAALAPLSTWEPPAIDVLVIATTSRFSADAVLWIERHNVRGDRPRIEPSGRQQPRDDARRPTGSRDTVRAAPWRCATLICSGNDAALALRGSHRRLARATDFSADQPGDGHR